MSKTTLFSGLARQLLNFQGSRNSTWCPFICRHYAKPLKRRPLKVYNADGEEVNLEAEKRPPVRRVTDAGSRSEERSYKHLEAEILGDKKYFKLTDSDKKFRRLYAASTQRKAREKHRLVVLEGKRLIGDALDAGAVFRGLYFSRVEQLEGLDLAGLDGLLYKLTHNQLVHVSGVTTPPGVMALCEVPTSRSLRVNSSTLVPITLICDNIRDPGNMGALLRSAAAVGCHKILVTKGNVDIWDPKVVRAGAGCHFRAHIRHNLDWSTIPGLLSPDCSLHLADRLHSKTFRENSIRETISESDSDSDIDGCTKRAFEDDNIEMQREPLVQRTTTKEMGPEGSDSVSNRSSKGPIFHNLPVVDAFGTDLVSAVDKETVLIIGGETHGLSKEALELAHVKSGCLVYLPMVTGVDSLNAAMAGTVLLYEIRRQLLQAKKDQNESITVIPDS